MFCLKIGLLRNVNSSWVMMTILHKLPNISLNQRWLLGSQRTLWSPGWKSGLVWPIHLPSPHPTRTYSLHSVSCSQHQVWPDGFTLESVQSPEAAFGGDITCRDVTMANYFWRPGNEKRCCLLARHCWRFQPWLWRQKQKHDLFLQRLNIFVTQ